jgi:hypothetical protein
LFSYSDCSSLVGTTDEGILKQYYYDAYGRIRQFSDCLLTIAPLLYQQGPRDSDWSSFMPPPQWNTLRHEWHRYQIWGFEVKKNLFLLFFDI